MEFTYCIGVDMIGQPIYVTHFLKLEKCTR